MNRLENIDIKGLLTEYEYDPDDIMEDDDRTRNLKQALSLIPPVDKIIFLLYLDMQSSRKVGKLLGVSHNIVLREIKRIKTQILDEYDKLTDY